MRGALAGALSGALGLLVLHALVARANQTQLTGLVGVATGFVERFLNPAIPAIPDRSASSAPSSSSTSTPTYPATNVPASAYAGVKATYPAPTAR